MRTDELSYRNGYFEKEEIPAEENAKNTEIAEDMQNTAEEYDDSGYIAGRTARKQKRNAKIRRKHNFVKAILALLCLFGVLLTPVFNIKSITVSGNSYLSEEQVIVASGITKNSNIFVFQTKKAVNGLESLSFVDAAKITRTFPSGVKIQIKECTPAAQISCGQALYLAVDKSGKILDAVSDPKKYDVPCISGVTVTEFEVGEKVKTQNNKLFTKLLLLACEINETQMTQDVESIYVKNAELYVKLKKGVTCNLGQGDNLSYRIKFINEVCKSIPEGKTGSLEFVEEYKAVFTEDEK